MATKVHRVRYYNPKPQPINCITLNTANKNLALARSDASIEIWDLNYAPYLSNFIPGVENGSVEALGWVHDRLLSTGLGGALVEWDLEKQRVRNSVLLTGYAAWCLDVSSDNTMVAVGTEQGYVNLYNVENNEIVYKKLFDKQEGRILCCKFNKTGNIIVTGSINTIRVWNVETGQATTRMTVSRRGKEVIVWCITILSDDTVVSGDSHGRLTFWDNIIGNELESYITHKADILSIAVSEDENSLFCSGVDPVISNFVRIKNKQDSDAQWVKHVQRNIHEHDVRGLVLNGKELISVGIDGYLTFSSYPPKWVMRIPHMLPAPRSSVCAQKKLLLLRYSHHIEVWKLGSCTVNESDNALIKDNIHMEDRNHQINNIEEDSIMDKIKITMNNVPKQSLRITEKPVKLVSVQTKGKKQIKSCELSPSGEFIVYSTDSHIRMLKLETDEDQSNISLSKVMVNGVSTGCERFAFTNDSRWMIVYCTGNVNVLQVDPEAGATVVQSLSVEKHLSTKSIVHLLVSKETRSGTTYLMVADTLGSVTVWKRSGKKFEHYINLPKYQCVPSAMTIDNECENLIITYVDQKIVEYDLVNKKFTEWPGSGVAPEWYQRSAAVDSILPHPNGNAVLFQDLTALWVMDRRLQEQKEPDMKKKFQHSGEMNFGLKVIPIKYIADFHWIGKDEAVLLEVLPENIVSQLPAVAVTNKKRDRL